MSKITTDMILKVAAQLADEIKTSAILIIAESKFNDKWLEEMSKVYKLILVSSKPGVLEQYKNKNCELILSPSKGLTWPSKIRHSLIVAMSRGYLKSSDDVICISDSYMEKWIFNSVAVLNIGKQFRGLMSIRRYVSKVNIPWVVIETVLDIAVGLGTHGRENQSIGSMFMIGDAKNVLKISRQLIFNPFRGYQDKEKNIRNPIIRESISELAKIDGAFILKNNGVLCSAGRILLIPKGQVKIIKGLGTRHNAVAHITKKTNAIGVVVSESTGFVSIFAKGKLLLRLTTLDF